MKHKLRMTLGLVFMLLIAFTMPVYGAEDVPRISTEQLKDILGNPDLILLDVRTEKEWGESDRKIVGAVRVDPDDVSSWAGEYTEDQKIILYCA
jgi:rhodanese-related sulfurtransferase